MFSTISTSAGKSPRPVVPGHDENRPPVSIQVPTKDVWPRSIVSGMHRVVGVTDGGSVPYAAIRPNRTARIAATYLLDAFSFRMAFRR